MRDKSTRPACPNFETPKPAHSFAGSITKFSDRIALTFFMTRLHVGCKTALHSSYLSVQIDKGTAASLFHYARSLSFANLESATWLPISSPSSCSSSIPFLGLACAHVHCICH